MSVTVERVNLRAIFDTDPELSWLEQFDINDPDPETRKHARLDRIRLRAYHRGVWHCVGLVAEAEFQIHDEETKLSAHVTETRSAWGIESDSDVADFVEVWAYLWADLEEFFVGTIGPATPILVLSTPDMPDVDR